MTSIQSTNPILPKIFFIDKDYTQALLHIRRCYEQGLTAYDMVRELRKDYLDWTNTDPDHKRTLEKLMTVIYDFECPSMAQYLATYYKIVPEGGFPKDRSISQYFFKEAFQNDRSLPWLDDYNESLVLKPAIERSFDDPRFWMVVPTSEKKNVITLCKDLNLYCVIEADMSLNLLGMVNNESSYIINEPSDNVVFAYGNVENPQDDYFISPVFLVRVAKKILEYCLARVGYPAIQIKMKAIYTSPTIELIPWEEFYNTEMWEGVDVILAKTLDKKTGFLMNCPYHNLILAAKDFYDRDMLRMLYASLAATSKILNDMKNDPDSMFYTTNKDMQFWSERNDLFQSDRNKK